MTNKPCRAPYRPLLALTGLCLLGSLPINTHATNGLYSHAYGSRQSGIAGSGVAFPQDSLIIAINPAGVSQLEENSYELDLQYFSPRRNYTINPSPASGSFPPFPGPEVESGSESFFIPGFGMNRSINDQSAWGFAIYGNGGMNTDWPASDTPFGLGTFAGGTVPGAKADAGVDYSQLFANLSYSSRFGDGGASWGVGAILNYSRIELNGVAGFSPFSLDPANLSDQGYDDAFGYGLKLGIQGDVGGVTLAASYQTEIANEFDAYSGLFPEGGKLHIPANAQLGLAADAGPGTITADIQYFFYSDAEGVGDPGTTGLPTQCMPSAPFTSAPVAAGPACLGGNPGLGFGWEDMTVFKLGYTWSGNNGWTWRVGASYGSQPVQEEDVTFNIIAPGVVEQHYTFGFSKKLASGKEASFALMYAPEKCISGPDLFTPGQTVELCMHQIAVNAGLTF